MGVLLMLMTIGGLVIAAVLLITAIVSKKTWLRNFVLGGVGVWVALYAVMLFGFSFASDEITLQPGEAKAFCGFYFDCHMHASVTSVRTTHALGDHTANGLFYIVKVRVFNDARAATLGLLTVDAHVVDGRGHHYLRDTGAEEHLPQQPPFEKQVSPSESFEKDIVFDLPADAAMPRLDVRDGYGIDHVIETFLIGDEDSLLHKRSLFTLLPSAAPNHNV